MIALYRSPTPAAPVRRPPPPPPPRGGTRGRTGAPLFILPGTQLLLKTTVKPDDFSALVAEAQVQGQGWTAFHFAAIYALALGYCADFRGTLLTNKALASLVPPTTALPDIAHVVVAWWWQNVANLEPAAFTKEGAAPFLGSAFGWWMTYGRELAPGMPSAIRWDLVAWEQIPWSSINFAAYDWATVKNRVKAIPASAFADTFLPGTIDWRSVTWQGSIPTTTTPWSAVGWATIPWAAMPWDVVRLLAGWLGLLGLSPSVVTYAGPLAQLQGQQLTPTAQLLAQVAERVPGSVNLADILAASAVLDPEPPPPPPTWPIPPIGPGDWPLPLPGDKKPPEPPPPQPPPPAAAAPPSQVPTVLGLLALLAAVAALFRPAAGSSRSPRRRRVRARRRLPAAMSHRPLVQAPPEVRARWNAQLASTPYTPVRSPQSDHHGAPSAAPSADLARALADGRLAGAWGPAHEAVLRAMVAQNPEGARAVLGARTGDVPLTGCPDGYEQVELFDRNGKSLDEYGCVNKKTGCLLGYEPDPANPGRCVFKQAGQPCGDKAGQEAGYKYDVNGNCVGPKGEVFSDACGKPSGADCPPAGTMPTAPPAGTPTELEGWRKYLTWKNAALAAAALFALGLAGLGPLAGFAAGFAASSAGAVGGGGGGRRRVRRRRR